MPGNATTKAYLLSLMGPAFCGADDLADALAPRTGTSTPSENADFIGQFYIKTDTSKLYFAVTTGTGASDWVILN